MSIVSLTRSRRGRGVALLTVGGLAVTALAAPTVADASPSTAVARPTVTSVAPRTLPQDGGVRLFITGTGLGSVDSVQIAGVVVRGGVTAVSSTEIEVEAPPYLAGGRTHVIVSSGSVRSAATAKDVVTYSSTPLVRELSSTTGPTKGGNRITITGGGFRSVRSVTFGTVRATSVVVNSPTSITATAPAGTGLVDVRVSSATAISATGPADHYVYGAPSLTERDFDPADPLGSAQIDDIACPAVDACIAVGRAGGRGGAPQIVDPPLAYVLSGSTWHQIHVPVPKGWQYAELASVACASTHECYAVGTATKGFYPQPSVQFIARNLGGTVTVETLPTSSTYGPIACAGTPGSCVLAEQNGAATSFLPLPGGSAPEQRGVDVPAGDFGGLTDLRCRASGSCVAWGFVQTGNKSTAFAEQSVDGVWRGTTLAPLAGDDSTTLATVICDTAHTCTGYGNSSRTDDVQNTTVTRPFRVQLAADGSLTTTQVAVATDAGQADLPVKPVSCVTPTRCIAVASAPYSSTGTSWVDGLTTSGWSSSQVAAPTAPDTRNAASAAQCSAEGYCFALGNRSAYTDFPTGESTAFLPLGSGFAQVDLPRGVHQESDPVMSTCAPTGTYCVAVLDDTVSAGLGGQAVAPYSVIVQK